MPCLIRPATEADLPQLEWEGEYTHYRLIFREMWEEMQRNRRLLLVAVEAAQVVGQVFLQFYSSDPRYADGHTRAYLYSLRVRPPWQGQGLGTRLIQNAEAALRERGFKFAVIAAAKDNPGALRLYERLGYQQFDDDPGVWYFTDVNGVEQRVAEPCWVLQKLLDVEVSDWRLGLGDGPLPSASDQVQLMQSRHVLASAFALMVLGGLLLLHNFGLLPVALEQWWPGLVALGGLGLLARALLQRQTGRLLLGLVALALGSYWLLAQNGVAPNGQTLPVLLMALGVGALVRNLLPET